MRLSSLIGHVEAYDRGRVKGWALCRLDPKAPVEVQVTRGGIPVAVGKTGKRLPGLADIGFSDNMAGFEIVFDKEAHSGDTPIKVRAALNSTAVRLPVLHYDTGNCSKHLRRHLLAAVAAECSGQWQIAEHAWDAVLSASAGGGVVQTIDAAAGLARARLRLNRLGDAVAAVRQSLELAGQSAQRRLRAVAFAVDLGLGWIALDVLESLSRQDRASPEVWQRLAEIHLDAGLTLKAQAALAEGLICHPEDPRLRALQARLLGSQLQIEPACGLLEKIPGINSHEILAVVKSGLRAGARPAEIRSLVAPVVQRLSTEDSAWLSARTAELRGEWKDSINGYRALLAQNPDRTDTAIGLARVLARTRTNLDEAAATLRKAVEMDPVAPEPRRLLAALCNDSGDPFTAMTLLAEMPRLYPERLDLLRDYVRHARAAGRIGEARSALESAFADPAKRKDLWGDMLACQAAQADARGALLRLAESDVTEPQQLAEALTATYRAAISAADREMLRKESASIWRNPIVLAKVAQLLMRRSRLIDAQLWFVAAADTAEAMPSAADASTLAAVARSLGEFSKAQKFAELALEAAPIPRNQLFCADLLTDRGRLDEALELIEHSRLTAPKNDTLCLRAVTLRVELGSHAQVEQLINEVLKRKPGDAEACQLLIEFALVSGWPKRAAKLARRLPEDHIARIHERKRVLTAGLRARLRRNDLKGLRALLDRVSTLFGTLIQQGGTAQKLALELLAWLVRFGQPTEVIKLIEKARPHMPESRKLAELRSQVADRRGNLGGALGFASKVHAHERHYAAALRRRVELLSRLGRMSDAAVATRELLLADEEELEPHLLQPIVTALELDGDGAAAESVLRSRIVREPNSFNSQVILADFLLRHNRLDAELNALNRSISQGPPDAAQMLRKAYLLFRKGLLREADDALEGISETYGDDEDYLQLHFLVRHTRLQTAAASDLVDRAAQRLAGSSRALRWLAGLAKRQLHNDRANDLLMKAREICGGSVGIDLALAEAALEINDFKLAERHIDNVLRMAPLNSRGHHLHSVVRQARDDLAGAVAAVFIALRLDPTNTGALEHRAMLLEETANFDEARRVFRRSVAVSQNQGALPSPRALWHLVQVDMMCGDIPSAIASNALQCQRLARGTPSTLTLWQGEDLTDRSLFVAGLGGPGDEVRIISTCADFLLAQKPRKISYACDARMAPLLRRTFPEIHFIPAAFGHRQARRPDGAESAIDVTWPAPALTEDGIVLPYPAALDHDFVCHPFHLVHEAYFKRILPQRGLMQNRLIKPDLALVEQMREYLRALKPGTLKVGLSWRGSYFSRYRRRTFLALEELEPLLTLQGVQFIDLQVKKIARETRNPLFGHLHTLENLNLYDDFDGTVALLSQLDLVITTGTTMRDLAGCAGARTWSITVAPGALDAYRISTDPDSRHRDRLQPSITHYEINSRGSRADVLRALVDDLTALIEAPGSGSPRAVCGLAPDRSDTPASSRH